jgi:uncharacterized protein (DUF1499 family)
MLYLCYTLAHEIFICIREGNYMSQLKSTVLILALIALATSVLWHGIAGLGVRFGFWGIRFGLGTMSREWAPNVFYMTMGLGALALALNFFIQPRRIAGFIIGVLAITVPLAAKVQTDKTWALAQTLPPIHDITTDREDPPMFTEAIMNIRNASGSNSAQYLGKRKPTRDGSSGALVADLQAAGYPDIVPIRSNKTPNEIYQQAIRTVEMLGWEIVTDDSDAGIIEATDTTFWYGFKDDVIIRIRPSEQGGSVVDVRSLSRIGGSDIGKNADRIREFRNEISN